MKIYLVTAFVIFAVQAGIKAQTWQFKVDSVNIATNVAVYFGDGPDLCQRATMPFGGGGMSRIFIQQGDDGKNYSYTAGEIKSSTNEMFLIVICTVTNASEAEADFPVDVTVGDKPSLAAVGVGSDHIPFAKSKVAWDKFRQGSFRKLWNESPHVRIEVTFIFTVSKNSSSWKMMYQGKPVSELKTTTN